MTFVVARIIGDDLFIESDSRVTDQSKVRQDPLCGLLKTVLVCPTICISFAGSVHFAELALRKIIDEKVFNAEAIYHALLTIADGSRNSVEFIIASIENGLPKLCKVSDGVINRDLVTAWIGDYDAFKLFQEKMLSVEGNLDQVTISRAFKEVIDEPSLTGVGDFQISVFIDRSICQGSHVFMYAEKFECYVPGEQAIPAGQRVALSLGTAPGGAYGLSYLVSLSKCFFGIAIYFHIGGFGVLFCPQISLNGIIIYASSGEEFALKILDDYKIPMSGLVQQGQTKVKLIDTRDMPS
tara:strand:- start:17937 stop:18824 length:888 start_codon:yes stop_codon:yes gene_type:complete